MWYSVDFTKKKDHNLYDKTFKNLFEEFYFTNMFVYLKDY